MGDFLELVTIQYHMRSMLTPQKQGLLVEVFASSSNQIVYRLLRHYCQESSRLRRPQHFIRIFIFDTLIFLSVSSAFVIEKKIVWSML
jgi:hypothetical protein